MGINDKIYFDDFAYIIQNNCSLNFHDNKMKKRSSKNVSKINEEEINLSIYTSDNEDLEISENESNGQEKQDNKNLRNAFLFKKNKK